MAFSFGAPATTPSTGLFAAPTTSSGGFSFGGAAPVTTASGGFTFGSGPGGGGSLFGAPSTTTAAPSFGAPATQSLFSMPTATSTPAGGLGGGSLFGTSNAAPAPAFGTSTTGGLFGQTQTAPPQPSTGSIFGAPAVTTTAAPTGGLFGAPASGGTSGSIFGAPASGTTSSGLFGSSTQPTTASSTGGGGLFGTQQPAAAAPGGMFGSAAPTSTATATSGMLGIFGATAQPTTASTGMTFGRTVPAQPAPPTGAGFTFAPTATQQPAPVPPTGMFGTSTASAFTQAAKTTAPTAGLFTAPQTAPATVAGFGLGGSSAATAPATSGFTFGTPQSSVSATPAATSGTSIFGAPSTTGTATQPHLGATQPHLGATQPHLGATQPHLGTTQPTLSLTGLTQTQATPSTTVLSMGVTPTTTAAPPAQPGGGIFANKTTAPVAPFPTAPTSQIAPSTTGTSTVPSMFGGLPTPSSTTPTPTLPFTNKTTTAPATGQISNGATLSLTLGSNVASTVPTSSTVAPSQPVPAIDIAKQMTFGQLEGLINRWTYDLQEQERAFLNQATEVNAWDRVLRENGQKILQLNSDVESVESSVTRANHELDFVAQQQCELEEALTQLEVALGGNNIQESCSLLDAAFPQGAMYPPMHSDRHRQQILSLQIKLDGQLKQMTSELDSLGEEMDAGRGLGDEAPLQQISNILAKQMDTLQWIDGQAGKLEDDVKVIGNSIRDKREEFEKSVRFG